MAMMRVRPILVAPSKQQGTSLIELMVASVIGVFAISIIGSVFITGQRIATDKGIELLLLQNLTSTLQVMKEDIQRAGYDGSNGYSIKLSGASNTIQVSGGVAVGFVYFREGSDSDKDHRHIVYRKNGTRLQICEKGMLVSDDLLSFNEVTSCYSLFDDNLIDVDEFNINYQALEQNSIKTTLTDISITASIPTAGVSKSLSVSVKQRNWQ
ncbi:type IV pilus assembly protein PilW [Vibrio crassostreae]|uniref:PilW family protein n=1 Tax=Vibrio crassostreae TaxID=246167 RepID=UPI001BD3DE88|nr:pilus assembly protein PilW [Vibrio crassostreae]CAK1720436.1 type IV pilus assembly protein PilW [Vibrio crassostreae]CAK1746200.1 type IV pilus assembly protein PilW [Vibrio crassostreae]CAK1765779.1 type IV pilus assembly protein PilW [Vibrio crassostreae]CAK1801608.1 type IV pilus assembly protein PilW [Vibrio crassostreae]CAK1870093.1 type IV pilus assembly protein PilW [Vibrio crassostreae]